MNDLFPARVSRRVAMQILCITSKESFRKVVDANPQVVHRLPGESRNHYLRDELVRLLRPRCATQGEGTERLKAEGSRLKTNVF